MFSHLDDAGKVEHDDCTVLITGKKELLNKSYQNYKKLMAFRDGNSKHFQKYIPHNIEKVSNEELKITFYEKAYSLQQILQQFNGKIDQPHVNWILSRILELLTWLSLHDIVHNGINLDSLYVIPRNHGLVCISFYHLTKANEKLSSVSGRYINMYPAYNIVNKIATPSIDITLAKRTAMYLMGDKTSMGHSLVGDVHYNEALVDFLRKEDFILFDTYNEYRNILTRFYNTKQFHELIIEEK